MGNPNLIMKSLLLVALAFAAVAAEPEADAEAYYSSYYGYPGYYNRNSFNNFNYNRGYGYSGNYGFPSRTYYFNNNWNRMNNFRNFYKREAEAEPTAVTAPEADARMMYGYSYGYPSQMYGYSGYYGMPSRTFYGNRIYKRDAEATAEAEAAAEAYNNYYGYSGYANTYNNNRWGGYRNNWYNNWNRMNNYYSYGMRPYARTYMYGRYMY